MSSPNEPELPPVAEPVAPDLLGGFIAWMTHNPVAANLMMIVIFVGGLLQLTSVKQEVFPEFQLDMVAVSVAYPGASPAEVEQGIVLAAEEAVRAVDGVKKVTATASENVGVVVAELLVGADADKALQDIKGEIDRISTFPEEAEDPQVVLVSRRQRVVSLVISGPLALPELQEIAERARADLLVRRAATQIEVEGLAPNEIAIEIDRATLQAQGLTLDDVSRQIGLASLELPGGALESPAGEILVRVADRRRTGAEFGDIVLRGARHGGEVRLGQVATIRDGFEDNDQATYFNGEPAVLVSAFRVGDETPTGVADAVRAYGEELQASLPPGVDVTVWDDDSELLRARIDLLVRNAQMGLALVFLVLALFLELRLAFWVSWGIPTSFLGAFLLFPSYDVSINMISLFALIIVLGIVVDDAIVVGENIYEKIEKGMRPMQAAIAGTVEMITPVTFSVLTTVAAFSPLLVIPGVSGKIFGLIPIVVISVLLISLVESFFILPRHLSHETGAVFRWIERYTDPVRKTVSGALERFAQGPYDRLLRRLIEFRYATVGALAGLVLVAFGLVATGLLPFSFLPKTESDLVRVSVRLPFGVAIEQTERVRAVLEDALDRATETMDAHDEIRGRLTKVGQGLTGFGPAAAAGAPIGSHLLTLEVDLVPLDERTFTTAQFEVAWQAEVPPLPGVESVVFSSSAGPSGGAAVDVQLSHPDTEVLAAASEEVAAALRGYTELRSVQNGYAGGKVQLDFTLLDAARTVGLTAGDVARQVRSALFGAEAIREQRGRNELKVMVRLPADERVSEHDLDQLDVRTPTGAWTPLASVAAYERERSATSITREAGRRVVDVTADLSPGVRSSRPVLEDLEARVLPELRERYPGLTARFAGEAESQAEALGSLGRNYLFALFVIFALVAIPFKSYSQPLIVMAAIPFGFIGSVGGHVLHGYELSVISVMGIIAASGVVVNDSIVLVDAINGFRAQGLGPLEAAVTAGKRRVRPILLTSLTTFFGLIPMIFETSVQARFLVPMAVALAYGVAFTTITALLAVPCLYLIVEDLVALGRWVIRAGPAPWTAAPAEAPAD